MNKVSLYTIRDVELFFGLMFEQLLEEREKTGDKNAQSQPFIFSLADACSIEKIQADSPKLELEVVDKKAKYYKLRFRAENKDMMELHLVKLFETHQFFPDHNNCPASYSATYVAMVATEADHAEYAHFADDLKDHLTTHFTTILANEHSFVSWLDFETPSSFASEDISVPVELLDRLLTELQKGKKNILTTKNSAGVNMQSDKRTLQITWSNPQHVLNLRGDLVRCVRIEKTNNAMLEHLNDVLGKNKKTIH